MARTLLFVISCLLCQISWAEQHAKVLLLNSYHAQYRWTEQLTKGVQDTLSGKVHQENLHVEFMDARRFVDDPAYDKMMVDLLRHKYRQYRPDVVITADDHAYYFMIEHGQQLFGDTPIVFCGVNVFYPETREGKPHMVGIQEGMDIMGNLELITRLQPEVRRIVMLGDRTGLGARMIERANVIKARWRTNPDRQPVVLETWDNFVLQDLYEQAATMSLDTAFLMLAIHKDANGQYFSFDNELRVLTEASKVPVYGMWGALMIGNGVVGGNMNSPYQHGFRMPPKSHWRYCKANRLSNLACVPVRCIPLILILPNCSVLISIWHGCLKTVSSSIVLLPCMRSTGILLTR